MKLERLKRLALSFLFVFLTASPAAWLQPVLASAAPVSTPINHIVVIYMENWSFDALYGLYPGANGLNNAANAAPQVDKTGKVYATLPPIINSNLKPPGPDTRFPADMPNKPFAINKYVPADQLMGDLVHRFYQEQQQIDGGKMDKFAAISDAGGEVMGYYDTSSLPLWQWAKQYTLSDNFFHAAFGGSFLNHFWLICACSPKYDNAPASLVAKLDSSGNLMQDGAVTPDGYAVNTIQSIQSPHSPSITDTTKLLPVQSLPTIGDRLNDKNISWAWYSGGWNDALAGKADPLFQFHHQPFAYFKQFADGTPQKAQHLKDETDFISDIDSGKLPAVSFFKPLGPDNEHPGYATLQRGEQHIDGILKKLQQSPNWKDTAVIITYDENGGQWDHVAPPKVDKWGPGTRVPTIIISPYAKKGYIDHTQYDTTSILKFIENRYDLQPLADRDAKATDLVGAFNFAAAGGGVAGQGGGLPASGQGGGNSQDNGSVWLLIPIVGILAASSYGLKKVRSRRS